MRGLLDRDQHLLLVLAYLPSHPSGAVQLRGLFLGAERSAAPKVFLWGPGFKRSVSHRHVVKKVCPFGEYDSFRTHPKKVGIVTSVLKRSEKT